MNKAEKEKIGLLAEAMRKVMGASSSSFGADCAAYAAVGAIALKRLGFKFARPAAGSAVWRVGPGDGDVINHAADIAAGSAYALKAGSPDAKALMFHAWVMLDAERLVDFTTHQLKLKAQLLDQQDGGNTAVDWCPDYLLTRTKKCLPLQEVAQSFNVGVFSYRREPKIEALTLNFDAEMKRDQEAAAAQVLMAYELLAAGSKVEVKALDEAGNGFVDANDAAKRSLDHGLKPMEI